MSVPAKPLWYDHDKVGTVYKPGQDPEVTCQSCARTFLCDAMDAVCRQCAMPYDVSRVREFYPLGIPAHVATNLANILKEASQEQDLVYRLRKRAEIRRGIQTRKSVQQGEPDRIADLLEEAAAEIEGLRESVEDSADRAREGGLELMITPGKDHPTADVMGPRASAGPEDPRRSPMTNKAAQTAATDTETALLIDGLREEIRRKDNTIVAMSEAAVQWFKKISTHKESCSCEKFDESEPDCPSVLAEKGLAALLAAKTPQRKP